MYYCTSIQPEDLDQFSTTPLTGCEGKLLSIDYSLHIAVRVYGGANKSLLDYLWRPRRRMQEAIKIGRAHV